MIRPNQILTLAAFLVLAVSLSASADEATDASKSTTVSEAGAAEEATMFPVEDYSGAFGARSRLTGDWGGGRTWLAEHGLQVELNINQVYYDIVDGGKTSGSEYGGNAELVLKFDSQKMGLWPGGFLFIRAEQFFEDSINSQTGALMPVNTVSLFPEPADNDLALSHFQLTQFLSPHLALSLGKLDTSVGDMNEFAHGRGDTKFMNTAFSFNPVIAMTAPYSTLGAALIIIPNEKAMITFSAIDTEGSAMTSGFDTVFDEGTTYVGELRITTNFFGQPGHQTFGAAYSNDEFFALNDVIDVSIPRLLGRTGGEYSDSSDSRNLLRRLVESRIPGAEQAGEVLDSDLALFQRGSLVRRLAKPVVDDIVNKAMTTLYVNRIDTESSSWAVYYNFDQYLYTEAEDPAQGVGIFGRIGFADEDTNPIEAFYSIGVGGKGLIPTRDLDRFGIGFYYMDMSDNLPKLLRFSHEQGFELFYDFAVTPWLRVTPDIQIINPASDGNDTTVVWGIRTLIRF
ncbi:MAG TPA: carbohydrate porin [Candidatus Hydrogenedentes bacterium]|nr:carbohydrate porin [Candidatus Hydrogenedentota bacterium]